jgi:putative thiamine transport system ATP-binding protein
MNPLILERIALTVNGERLFAPLSLTVEPGAVTSITGPSGAGKSSLLKYLCGILPPEVSASGTVRIGDDELTSLPPERRGLGLLFQDPLLFPHLDVAGNLLFGLRRRGSRRERRRQAEDALESVGLAGLGARDPATLSGGQQARVALLRVLLAEPRALLLDEPFRSLDQENRERVRELVFAEAVHRGLPTLLVTHDRSDVTAAGGPVVELSPPTAG